MKAEEFFYHRRKGALSYSWAVRAVLFACVTTFRLIYDGGLSIYVTDKVDNTFFNRGNDVVDFSVINSDRF